jgi:hypothetical protein
MTNVAGSAVSRVRALGRPLQARQGVGRAGDEPSAERGLQQPAPPAWREIERSVERDAAGVGTNRRNLDDFVVRHAERQADVKGETAWSNGVLHQKRHLHAVTNACAEHESISGAQLTLGRIEHLRIRPSRQLRRRCDQMPHALDGRVDDFRRTHVQHRSRILRRVSTDGFQPSLSATIGSTRVARRAGI